MKTAPVTFDSIDISVHQRYAKDQALLDPTFLAETQIVAHHPEITSISRIYSSKWEELFELYKRSSSWAFFCPPSQYLSQSKRFFSHCLLPTISWSVSTEGSDNKNGSALPSLYSREPLRRMTKEEVEKTIHQTPCPSPDDEEQKLTILSLINTIDTIDTMLGMIHGRKAQQKG